jgi:hypothetical protein
MPRVRLDANDGPALGQRNSARDATMRRYGGASTVDLPLFVRFTHDDVLTMPYPYHGEPLA